MRFQNLPGQRSHQGEVVVLGEPNTIGYLFDMLLKKGSTTGSDPYTHPFTLASADPNSYTVEFLKGQVVHRFVGVQARSITPSYDTNKMQVTVELTARSNFTVGDIGAITGGGPYDVTLKTAYDPTPTQGLVAGDLVRIFLAGGTTIDTTITTVDDATGITLPASPSLASVAADDLIGIRALTPSLTLIDPFLWSRTEFRFGATASAADSATHTPVETGSNWKILHNMLPEEGALRSGAFDPASLVRGQGDAEANVNKFFDTPDEENRFRSLTKRALVIKHFSGTGYELRVTLNNLKQIEKPVNMNTGELLFDNITFRPEYDTTDTQMFDVKVLNAVASI